MERKLSTSKHSVIPAKAGIQRPTQVWIPDQVGNDKLKKLLHFFTLLTLKEAYLTCRNFLGLIFHPFKTIKVIRREADPVQTLLIFGLPFYFWLGGVGMVLVARYLIGIHLFPMGFLAKTLLFLTSFLASAIFSYLLYWAIVYVRRKNV